MLRQKTTSAMLLIILLSFTISGCKDKLNIDLSIFSHKFQKFYMSNEATGEKAEFPPTDIRADRLVCMPYNQYIDFQKTYECKPKSKKFIDESQNPALMSLPVPTEITE